MSLTFRRHYRVVLLLALVLAVLVAGLGKQRIIAYNLISDSGDAGSSRSNAAAGALFDDSAVHTVQILIKPADYEQMISTYRQTGEKDWFHADVVIDGTRVNDVGIRLKGNASLRTALGGGGRGGMPGGAQGGQPGDRQRFQAPADGEMPEGWQNMQPPADGQMPQRPDGWQGMAPPADGEMPEGWQGFRPPADGALAPFPQAGADLTATVSSEVKLPFLIRFDKFVKGQTYQGLQRLCIRNYGISSDAAMLHEPVTNAMGRLAGLPTTRAAFAGVALNGEPERLYVICEAIDETYLDSTFDYGRGVMYKAEVNSSLNYKGDDPSAYASSFSQETRENDADMGPLIALARFLTESDEATFEAELPQRLDVEAFATYLALNALLVNTDSMVGMSNNYYLYYDDQAGFFTLLMWDANESLGKLSMGGGAQGAQFDLYLSSTSMRMPGGGSKNILLQRFMANATFQALYEAKLQEVYQKVFLSGALAEKVEEYAALIREVNPDRNLVDLPSYDQAVAQVQSFVAQRYAYLSTTPLLARLATDAP